MLKLIQRLIIIALAILAILFVHFSLAEACGNWALEGSQITGSKYGSGQINLCHYQDLNGSGQVMKMRLPTYKECPFILNPCPPAGSNTEIIVNQRSEKFEKLMDEYLQLKNQ